MSREKTADNDVKHATWESLTVVTPYIEEDDEVVQLKCSNCKKYSFDIWRYGIPKLRYCTCCGARMDNGG